MKELARGGTVRQSQSWDLNPVALLAAEPKLSVPCHGGLSQTDGWTALGQGEKGTLLTGRQTADPALGSSLVTLHSMSPNCTPGNWAHRALSGLRS